MISWQICMLIEKLELRYSDMSSSSALRYPRFDLQLRWIYIKKIFKWDDKSGKLGLLRLPHEHSLIYLSLMVKDNRGRPLIWQFYILLIEKERDQKHLVSNKLDHDLESLILLFKKSQLLILSFKVLNRWLYYLNNLDL